MSTWQLDSLDLFREARVRATETSNIALHQVCGRAIEALVAEGGWVPADLWNYVCKVRRMHGIPAVFVLTPVSATYVG